MTALPTGISRLALLLTLLLVPREGLAAPGPLSEPPLPGTAPRASLRLLQDADTGEEPAPRATRQHPLSRILAEAGLGLLTSLGGGILGLIPPIFTCKGWLGSSRCDVPFAVGMSLGVGIGAALGVFWGGNAVDGEGKFFQGAIPGMAGGLVVAALLGLHPKVRANGAAAFSIPLGLVGAIVGYELSNQPGAQARLQPTAILSPRGASLGLAGTF